MKTQIRTTITVEAALAAGMTEHGELLVEPTTEQLEALAPEQRAALGPYAVRPRGADYVRHLTVHGPGWAGIVAGLAAARAEEEHERTQREAAIESERRSYRAMLSAGYYYEPGTMPPPSTRSNSPMPLGMRVACDASISA